NAWDRLKKLRAVRHVGPPDHQDVMLVGRREIDDAVASRVHDDAAAARKVGPVNALHQRRLAGARLPGEADDLALVHLERDAVERRNRLAIEDVKGEFLVEVFDFEDPGHSTFLPSTAAS